MKQRSIPHGNEALLIDFQMTAAHTQPEKGNSYVAY